MPRKARIDAPGVWRQIIVRGIERRKILYDDLDRDKFKKIYLAQSTLIQAISRRQKNAESNGLALLEPINQ